MKINRQFLWFLLLICPLLWLVWPSGDKTEKDANTQPGLVSKNQTQASGSRETDGGRIPEGTPARSPRRHSDRSESGPLPGVDRILANDRISHEQAALQLRELSMDRNLPMEERLEALRHGLNLDIGSFAGFAEQADLPAGLASHYLHEITNHNNTPDAQIKACIALVAHPDKEVSELAREMLALHVGDDMQKADQAKLIQLGRRKLDELATESTQ